MAASSMTKATSGVEAASIAETIQSFRSRSLSSRRSRQVKGASRSVETYEEYVLLLFCSVLFPVCDMLLLFATTAPRGPSDYYLLGPSSKAQDRPHESVNGRSGGGMRGT